MLKKTLPFSLLVLITYTGIAYIIVKEYDFGEPEISAFTAAGLLAVLNLLLTLFLIDKNLAKKQNEFMKSFMQSTMVRLVIILAIFFTIMVAMPLNHFVFSIGFFILYFLFQIIEIYILHTNKHSGK